MYIYIILCIYILYYVYILSIYGISCRCVIDISVDNSSIIAIRLAVDLVFGCMVLRHHGWFLETSTAPQDSEILRF